jgi:hypothetical protein
MKMHAIVEIEEGALNLIVGGREGTQTTVLRSVRIPLADLATATVENALRTISSDMLQGADGVHVVIGDRRSQHFLSTIPMMGLRDAEGFVVREALRLANLQGPDDIMVTTRLVRQLPGKKLLLGSSALGRSIWAPVAAAFENSQLKVLSLQTMESCLALATDAWHAEPVAVLECNGGRARYVVCIHQAAVKVRRFLIGAGGEHNDAALMTQLAMELPRTVDWLRESGDKLPRRLLIGSRVGLEDESLAMLANDDVGELKRVELEVECEEGMALPSMGIAALLNRLAHGVKPPSMLDRPHLCLPMQKSHKVAMLAAACVAVIGGSGAVVEGREWLRVGGECDQVRSQCVELQDEMDELVADRNQTDALVGSPLLTEALTMRRPISRLISEVSNSASAGIFLEEVQFASKSPIVISGKVQGATRQLALAAMGDFTRKVRQMPFVLVNGQDEMSEVAGQPNRFHFKLNLAWRNQ